ncbi:protein pxr1-like [Teratosphaeria destructans]|uniref:PinX1-related protein 1 n=1 Tax=Teratosphaeria destructans TaxID=418781 RepID=A0A9W7VZ81_9PEZI|nr:protein pxr1-like [Teratosphaeria destructans]
MGLGGQKKRTKLSQDPNNTHWSKSTTNFGHRILSKQGWKPGDFLGADNAAHQAHYTAANAAHIRVQLREDGLGLGAKLGGAGTADTFGLSLLSGVFGRLNGRSEAEVREQQDSLRDAGLRSWQAQKYGFMNFVSGGMLVGDRMEGEGEGVDAKMSSEQSTGKKRKSEAIDAVEGEPKKSRKVKVEKDEVPTEKTPDSEIHAPARSSTSDTSDDDDAATAKAKRKAEKKAKREAKERRRAEKAALKSPPDSESKAERRARREERRKRKEQKRATTSSSTSTTAPPSGTSTPTLAAGNRHAVRHRYIQQKRLASMDARALNEILMIKAVPAV